MHIVAKLRTNIKNDGLLTRLRTTDYTSNGGHKLFISNQNEFEAFFGVIRPANPVNCKIDRQSLINYMHNIYYEYRDKFLQKYKNIDISYWQEKYNSLVDIQDFRFTINNVTHREGNRVYISGDDGTVFQHSLWSILLPNISTLEIEKHEIAAGSFEYIFKPLLEFDRSFFLSQVNTETPIQNFNMAKNIIYFGSPGTGKSTIMNRDTHLMIVERTTFHPEYDYNSFVGGYKPTMVGTEIRYEFIPQIFTNIYKEAWLNLSLDDSHFCLLIEEINRGNCAEIFGDLFQLLDRDNDGFSEYPISVSKELKEYLINELGEGHPGIMGGKIKLPSNFSIYATMNTSDQSLFPMDSAFKRRWEWQYIPIDYNCILSDFKIKLNNEKKYNWLEFLKKVNNIIFEVTQSQDKQLGNWFIKTPNAEKIIDENTFKNKVLFYLWNDVFKDEENSIFTLSDKNISYSDLFSAESSEIIERIFNEKLDLLSISEPAVEENESTGQIEEQHMAE